MKKLLIASLLLASFSSQAAIIAASTGGTLACAQIDSSITPLSCAISTTTSFPTIIVEGQELDLNSDEASLRLLAEANGDAEAVLTSQIAHDLNLEHETVVSEIKVMELNNEELSVKNLLENLSK